ncbi:MAG: hypothetical protein DMG32_27550 [Acidobacteria bacterium]|nr:MAG: hypothetical protein DMG32_27550 [Acidobacteriota bacterium]
MCALALVGQIARLLQMNRWPQSFEPPASRIFGIGFRISAKVINNFGDPSQFWLAPIHYFWPDK